MKYFCILALLALSTFRLGAQTSVRTFASINDAIASTTLSSSSTNIDVLGYWTANDGGGGKFIYDKDSTATTNRGTIFKPTNLSGRLLRQHDPSHIKARWFGAKGTLQEYSNTLGPDDTVYLQAAFAYTTNYPNTTLEFGNGDFRISDTLFLGPYTTIKGVGESSRGDWIAAWAGTNSLWWNHDMSRTRIYTTAGMAGPAIALTITNAVNLRYPRGSVTAWDGTRYTNYYYGTHIEDLVIDCSINVSGPRSAHGIFIDRAAAVTIKGVASLWASGSPLRAEGTYELYVKDCYLFSLGSHSLSTFFHRVQDSKIMSSTINGHTFWLESCGENLYENNMIYNNFPTVEGLNIWTNVTTSAGSTVFTRANHNLVTGTPLLFRTPAPAGFTTNDTYYVYKVDNNTFKLNSLLAVPGQLSDIITPSGDLVGARNGVGLTNSETGTFTLTHNPDGLIYNHDCINGHWVGNRIDQSINNQVILTGPHCFMNSFIADTHLNMGWIYLTTNILGTNYTLPYLNRDIPWYAAYHVRNGSQRNTMHPAQVNGVIGQLEPSTWAIGNSIGWVIEDNCDYNNIGGGLRNCSTNFVISSVGTGNTIIDGVLSGTGELLTSIRTPIILPQQRGVWLDNSQTSRISANLTAFVIGTNDVTAMVKATYPSSTNSNAIFTIGPSSSDAQGSRAFYLLLRSDRILEVTQRSDTGDAFSGNFAASFFRRQEQFNDRDVWFGVTRDSAGVNLYVDGIEQVAYTNYNTGNWSSPIGDGTNYWHIGLVSNDASLNGSVFDALLFNFKLDSDQVGAIKNQPLPYKWRNGSFSHVTSGPLVYGMEYKILYYVAGDDFSNVGGENATGSVFVASGTSPTTWTNGSILMRLGVVFWPDIGIGYGTTFPDLSGNAYTATAAGAGLKHLIPIASSGTGDVVGPGSATDNAIVRFDGTTGKLVQDSAVTIADTSGDITGGKYNKVTITSPASGATLTISDGKTLASTASLTLAGTDSTVMTFPSTSATIARTDADQTFSGTQTLPTLASSSTLTVFGPSPAFSSSFPSLKRSSTRLQVRLADDSDYAPVDLGSGAAIATALQVTGGASGSRILDLIRTTGATQTYGFSISAGALLMTDATAGRTIAHLLNSGSVNQLILGSFSGIALPRASRLQGENVATGNSDIAGGTIAVAGGQSTGTGAGGGVIVQTSLSASSTASTVNNLTTRAYWSAKPTTLSEGSATTLCTITVGSSKFIGCRMFATVNADNNTDFQSGSSTIQFSVVNKAGTMTLGAVTDTASATACSSGTLTPITYTIVDNGSGVLAIKCNATSSLTQTTLGCTWKLEINSSDVATVTPN